MTDYFVPYRYYSSPLNFDPGVQAGLDIPENVTFYDSTVRKILMTPGVRLTVAELVEIALMGRAAGMSECFLNVHWWGSGTDPEPHAYQVAREVIAQSGYHVTLFSDVFSQDNWRAALRTLIGLRPKAVQVCLPMPDEAGERGEVDISAQRNRLREICGVLLGEGIEPTVGALDCGRTQQDALRDFIDEGLAAGCTRVDLSDSSSSLSPEAMKVMVAKVREQADGRPVTMHVHNDCGMANASCVAAVAAGAHPDVSACGISYRAGFASLEVVAAALIAMYGVDPGLDWDRVQELCARVGPLLPAEALRGISGTHAFVKESPGPLSRYLKSSKPLTSAPDAVLVAEAFGAQTKLVWGRQTVASDMAIAAKLRQLGHAASADQVAALRDSLASVLASRTEYPVWITDEEVGTLISNEQECSR